MAKSFNSFFTGLGMRGRQERGAAARFAQRLKESEGKSKYVSRSEELLQKEMKIEKSKSIKSELKALQRARQFRSEWTPDPEPEIPPGHIRLDTEVTGTSTSSWKFTVDPEEAFTSVLSGDAWVDANSSIKTFRGADATTLSPHSVGNSEIKVRVPMIAKEMILEKRDRADENWEWLEAEDLELEEDSKKAINAAKVKDLGATIIAEDEVQHFDSSFWDGVLGKTLDLEGQELPKKEDFEEMSDLLEDKYMEPTTTYLSKGEVEGLQKALTAGYGSPKSAGPPLDVASLDAAIKPRRPISEEDIENIRKDYDEYVKKSAYRNAIKIRPINHKPKALEKKMLERQLKSEW